MAGILLKPRVHAEPDSRLTGSTCLPMEAHTVEAQVGSLLGQGVTYLSLTNTGARRPGLHSTGDREPQMEFKQKKGIS